MGLQKRIALAGIAKQTAKGSAASAATYGLGLLSGNVLELEIEQEVEERTSDKRLPSAANRIGVVPGASFVTRAHPRSAPLLLYGALGTIATAGPVSTVYTHTLTSGDDVPYFSIFGREGSEYVKLVDAKLDELKFKWDERKPLEVAASFVGCDIAFPGSWSPTNNEQAEEYFRPGGGTFKLHTNSGTPVTAPVSAGEITIANSMDLIALSKSIKPDDVFPATQDITCSITTIPDNLTEWRRIVTGADAGTTIKESLVYGSFEFFFSIDANTDLKLESPRVAFSAKFPDIDAKGGAARVMLEGIVVRPSAGEGFTATVRNTVASY